MVINFVKETLATGPMFVLNYRDMILRVLRHKIVDDVTCLFIRIFVCGNLYNSNLMTTAYS